MTLTEIVDVADVMSKKDKESIQKVFPSDPQGKFLKGRHGITHYILESPPSSTNETRKLVVMSHGIGTSYHVFDEVAKSLLKAGYTVLRYDFFNHCFSVGSDPFLKIDDEVMVDQVEDLLQHVCTSDSEEICNFIGHSTGGVVAILSALRLYPKRKIRKLSLISPCLWANKPCAARLADSIPGILLFALKCRDPITTFLVSDSYIKNTDEAYAVYQEKNKKEYIYASKYKKGLKENKELFKHHPFATGGIFGVNGYFIRGDLLGKWREALKELTNRGRSTDKDAMKVDTRLIWGTLDVVVDYESPYMEEFTSMDGIELVPLERQGHESLAEDSTPISKACIEFMEEV